MVEKIIINPNKVRGYGNIVNAHTSTDYELSDCTITETTDTVNGATETVYELEDTILFFDPCRTDANQSSGYYVYVGTTSFDENGLTLSSVYNSSQYQMNVRVHNQVETVPFTVEFDMISNNTDKARLYFYPNGFTGNAIGSGTLWTSPQDEVTHFKFTVTSDAITRTVNGNTTTIANTDITTTVGVRFGYYQDTEGHIKIKNYKVKSI